MKTLAANIVTTMKRKSTHWRFLLEYKNEAATLKDALSQRGFYESILEAIEENDYSCKRFLQAYKVLLKHMAIPCPDDFLSKLYQVLLNKAFPGVTEDPQLDEFLVAFYLLLLDVINDFQAKSEDGSFMSTYPLELLKTEEIRALEDSEYQRFKEAFESQYIYTLLKLNQELEKRSLIEHILGVHYLAMHISKQLKQLDVPVDLGRVSGAAAGHDIGKFGVKSDEIKKMAYYHYYYTDDWFTRLDITYIRQVAVYHSTWDLELESLSLESLILIYSDFCVKRAPNKPGPFKMKFLNVDDAFQIILDKLDDVDTEKHNRYKRVYHKLRNFAEYLERLGVSLDVHDTKEEVVQTLPLTLAHGEDVVTQLKDSAIRSASHLMYRLRNVSSLNQILQEALGVSEVHRLRRYIFVIKEYFTYLTSEQKMITFDFLSQYMLHKEEDIRKTSGDIMGLLLATYDENYTKELPDSANDVYSVETKINKLEDILNHFLFNEEHLTKEKRKRQVESYIALMTQVYLDDDDVFIKQVNRILLKYFESVTSYFGVQFLLNMVTIMPVEDFDDNECDNVLSFILMQLEAEENLRMTAVSKLNILIKDERISTLLLQKRLIVSSYLNREKSTAEYYIASQLGLLFDQEIYIDLESVASELFLSNLKSATPSLAKSAQIEMLHNRCLESGMKERFYTAMHFCNILKVSAYAEVRNLAGRYLVELFKDLSQSEQNDITIELIRALEIEGYGFTRFIPKFLGQLIPTMSDKEYMEVFMDLEHKISNASVYVRVLLLDTLGAMVKTALNAKEYDKIQPLLGQIFRGFYSGNPIITQVAFNVLTKNLLGDDTIDLEDRKLIFDHVYIKLNRFMLDKVDTALDELNFSVGIHYIYHFITDYNFFKGAFEFEALKPVAFYSGTFDPFTVGQKKAVMDVQSLGLTVFVAVSEFQWRRRTQPSLMRKSIVEMSIADQFDAHLFPQSMPVNLKREEDLEALKARFGERPVYIVTGEEALLERSMYQDPEHKIFDFPHIIYKRYSKKYNSEKQAQIDEKFKWFKEDLKIRELPLEVERIESGQIRKDIDRQLDIYEAVDDLARHFIRRHRLYRNEPQFKSTVSISPIKIIETDLEDHDLCKRIKQDFKISDEAFGNHCGQALDDHKLPRKVMCFEDEDKLEIVGYAIYANAQPKDLFEEIQNLEILEEIKEKKAGRIIVIDYMASKTVSSVHAMDQIVVTETLSKGIKEGATYCVVRNMAELPLSVNLHGVLVRSGFLEKQCSYSNMHFYAVNMEKPIVLNLDGTTRMKSEFRQNEEIREQIKLVRSNLQDAIIKIFPGQAVLSFDRSMLYNHLIRLIAKRNQVKISKELQGDLICVPYGDIFKRWLLPNTITKAFHTERYYEPNLMKYAVESYPGYLSIENQTKVLKAYDRPVILVDDILDKGNRIDAFEAYLNKEEVNINQVIVGILSSRGKQKIAKKGIEVDSAYYIPNFSVWLNEADLYPFIGGDAVKREGRYSDVALYSANLMLPYSYPSYIKADQPEALYNMSKVCLTNALAVFEAIELHYLEVFGRNLTLDRLKDVMITPRVPDIGASVQYDLNQPPSKFLKNALERLENIQFKKME